ncbi:MAG: Urocanate reductase precursor [Syntrophus sp. PtaU1.Bin005]|jgi:fumarate reductase flavoprotein subunit|uniref:flavocytochrome c n=1 Tax=Syntrophus TaxID=43773 RepID=UPI0009CA5481|nr:MAG: Urocanate reductase precursor [Syntrophus sp. PtaB.Bin138]OPY81038.1 MAG: Urocanate reductase precursor [Syntrophus sp. PtaU1.Bin005]
MKEKEKVGSDGKRQATNQLNRRSFLKATAALGAVAGSGFALNMATPGSAEAAKRPLPKKWDETVEVLVIGSGFAGCSAAAQATSNGAKNVVVLEKMPTYGGNSIINGGVYASWDDKFHYREKLNLGNDSVNLHAEDTLKGGDYFSIPALVKVMAEGATDALNWMIDEGGAVIRPTVVRAGGHSAYRTHAAGIGKVYVDALKRIAEKNGAKFRLGTEVKWIWRADADPKSPVLGVEVKQGRKISNIKIQKGLILASGGFSRDIKMRGDHYPYLSGSDWNCTNHKGATGEMIRYAQAIGADTLQMNFIQLYPYADPETGILDTPALYPFNGPGNGIVYVTKQGKRFISELARRDHVSFAQIALGPQGKPTYTIFSDEMIEKFGGTREETEAGIKKGRLVRADSIAELAKKIGIPSDALVDTINKHNQYLAAGKDPEFNKPITKAMTPMTKGPFYAVAQWPAVHHTMGGLRINEKAQVIDIFGEVIPKLYAAGEVTGGVHGTNRLGSNAIPDCVVFGRVAGGTVVKEKA